MSSTEARTLVQRVLDRLTDCIETRSVVIQDEHCAKIVVSDLRRFHDRLPEIEAELHVNINCIVVLASDRAQLYVRPLA